MIVSENWLRKWVSLKVDSQTLADKLTMAGLEVGAIEYLQSTLGKVMVGKVAEVEAHPRGDRLKVCKVDIGRARLLQIVCGANNVEEGIRVPVALIGARLPNGMVIQKTRIRELVSSGMLCSGVELGLEESSEGLMVLDINAKVGETLVSYLGLNDTLMEMDLTPNRGDCLSILGVAREVGALTGARARKAKFASVKALTKTRFSIRLDAKKDCPRYVGRVIEGVNANAKTPDWMREHLRRAGLRCVSPTVDVTNFVMLELGQPMHAFDLDTLERGIVVRQSVKGERLKLLDGDKIKLDIGSLVIADHQRPIALAGIMGGEDTAIGDNTENILLESAFFRPNAIAGRARGYGLHTESSHRFERGVDPTIQKQAVERATELLLKIVGGQPGPVIEAVSKNDLPKRESITLRYNRLERVLGIKIPKSKVQTILTRLGMGVRGNRQGWTVSPPAYRFDVEKEHDLVEEVGRMHGYDDIPERAPKIEASTELRSEVKLEEARLRAGLIDRDYFEVITYSFVDKNLQRLFHPGVSPVKLVNPIAANMSTMRLSLWPGLIQALINNFNRQHRRIRLFEIGHNFLKSRGGSIETQKLAGVITGEALPKQWAVRSREVDFYDLKGDVEALLALTGRRREFTFRVAVHPALHPGQVAEIVSNKKSVGIFGQLHPDLQRQLDLEQSVYLFEMSLNHLLSGRIPVYTPFSKYPATRRDLSVLVDRKIPAQNILDVVSKVGGESLVKLELFDEYHGETIDSLRKSLAFGLTLQASSRTLREEEVEEILVRIIETLKDQFGAELRN